MIYYHTQNFASKIVVWSPKPKTLRDAAKRLARNNQVWPDKSTDGQLVTVSKRQRSSATSSDQALLPGRGQAET